METALEFERRAKEAEQRAKEAEQEAKEKLERANKFLIDASYTAKRNGLATSCKRIRYTVA